ncbi:hypothetical protein DN824_04095 [Stutzerimonas nosocomialis]|uniref:Phage infection protein n=1 Tax=Stutzerimonas nosocomialis TaxID=1056496 RepID=A0A5R9Q862_9GAMM|nr:hypothetical protein [Stutzerimonas nosocomialis]TLX59599.1 hypothetical protein DN826_02025 [Stutzerimonas nosocomialis]TLX60401.1 hypothetical protein DN824_04095 [Stutzerimonas nosocomialis]TLX61409.1 hypothetical protein DN820_21575 [Stutzerimonas nosocomialis]
MNMIKLGALVLAASFSSELLAQQGSGTQTQGSAMQETHTDRDVDVHDRDPDGVSTKMRNEVQEDWREDAQQRRESDAKRPEQGGG